MAESMKAFLFRWFSELNWKSRLWHAAGLLLVFASPEALPHVVALAGPQAGEYIVHAAQIAGILMNVWGRSPAVTPPGSIQKKSNVP